VFCISQDYSDSGNILKVLRCMNICIVNFGFAWPFRT